MVVVPPIVEAAIERVVAVGKTATTSCCRLQIDDGDATMARGGCQLMGTLR